MSDKAQEQVEPGAFSDDSAQQEVDSQTPLAHESTGSPESAEAEPINDVSQPDSAEEYAVPKEEAPASPNAGHPSEPALPEPNGDEEQIQESAVVPTSYTPNVDQAFLDETQTDPPDKKKSQSLTDQSSSIGAQNSRSSASGGTKTEQIPTSEQLETITSSPKLKRSGSKSGSALSANTLSSREGTKKTSSKISNTSVLSGKGSHPSLKRSSESRAGIKKSSERQASIKTTVSRSGIRKTAESTSSLKQAPESQAPVQKILSKDKDWTEISKSASQHMPKKAVSSSSTNKTSTSVSALPDGDLEFQNAVPAASVSTHYTGSQLALSASRASRRSRTSVRPSTTDEVWVPPEYDSQTFKSGAQLSDDCTLKEDTLVFLHSFGYDCLKPDNLCMLSAITAMFVSGNMIHFLNLQTKELTYMRSSTGGGIGHATVHPSYRYIAVAEKGVMPNVLLYKWPTLAVHRVLRGGTQSRYAYVSFSANGELLCSQGGDPDYMLTVWNWEKERTLLRCKAFSQDVYKTTFSPFHPGQLTSAGLGHIRFWKMAHTFTGLKLQGRIGRFGKTEISDIHGYLQLPDGKVVSGCEWGNILVWEDALIKAEITRMDNKPCHQGIIHKFYLEEGELITLGSDGWVRTWDFETLDQAEPTEDSAGKVAMDPMNELQFQFHASLCSMSPHPDPLQESIWFMQDSHGGIWRADLSFSMTTKGPEQLYECPAGPIRAVAACPTGTLMAVTGDDCTVSIFNYRKRTLLVRCIYPAGGNSLIWLAREVCGSTCMLLGGFADGCVRLMELNAGTKKGSFVLSLVYVQKPHAESITMIRQSPSGKMLVTAGKDGIVWFFSLLLEENRFVMAPLGFTEYTDMAESVTCLEFLPDSERKFLLFTDRGRVVEMRTPGVKDLTDHSTYGIKGIRGRSWTFRTVKSEILREEARIDREENKEKQRQALEQSIQERKQVGVEVEEQMERTKLEKRLVVEDREMPEIQLVVPDPPSGVLVGVPTADGTFTLLMDGWDAGWIHTATFRESRPQAVRVPDETDVGISVRRLSSDGQFLVLGMCDGRIRIHKVEDSNPWKLDHYWVLSMHDNTYGTITDIQFTYDQRNLITVGMDGNVFLYDFSSPDGQARVRSANIDLIPAPEVRVDDMDDLDSYTLEQQRQRSAHDARLLMAEQRKAAAKTELHELRRSFKHWIVLNQTLPEKIAVSHDDLLLDERIRADQRRRAEQNLETACKEMEWESEKYHMGVQKLHDRFKGSIEYDRVVVRSFRRQREISTFRVKTPSDSFHMARKETYSTISHLTVRTGSRPGPSEVSSRSKVALTTSDPDANRFEQMSLNARRQTQRSVGLRAYRALLRLEEKKTKRRRRRTQWTNLMANRPDENTDDPADIAAIQVALDKMGDFKLKTSADFKVVDSHQNTTHLKRYQLLSVKEQIYQHKVEFNNKVLTLRQRKREVLLELNKCLTRAASLQKQLPMSLHVQLSEPPKLAADESPEALYEITEEALSDYRKVATAAAAVAHQDPTTVAAATAAAAAATATGATASEQTAAEGAAPMSTLRRRSLMRQRQHAGPLEPVVHRTKPVPEPSETELRLNRVKEMRTLFARDIELKQMNDLIEEFDTHVYEQWQQMTRMEYELKSADLRAITRFRELMLVREFEKREASLNRILQEKLQEDTESQMMLMDTTQGYEARKSDQESIEQELKDLLKEVINNLPGDKFNKFLMRVYKKKIKRKPDAKKDDDEDSDSSSSMSDSDSDDDADADDEEEEGAQESWDINSCPPGCDQGLFEWVVQMRLKRGELELSLADKRLTFEVAKKEFENAQKKARGATGALQTSKDEINAFQLQKLARLNELEVAVSLHLSQLQLIEDARLSADTCSALVFLDSELERLAVRTDELYTETAQEKQHRRASYKEERRLKQDCRLMNKYIVKLEKQAEAEMRQKFGRLVNLEELESLSVNETEEELRIRLDNAQRQADAEACERKKRIAETRNELIAVVRDNTERVGVIQMLKDEKRHLDKGLNFVRKAGIAPHDKRLDDALEIQNFINTIGCQKTQIMELKHELWSLSLKSKPWRDPCQSTMQETEHSSSDDLDYMGSECSVDFLVSMGIVPEPPGRRGSQRGSGDAVRRSSATPGPAPADGAGPVRSTSSLTQATTSGGGAAHTTSLKSGLQLLASEVTSTAAGSSDTVEASSDDVGSEVGRSVSGSGGPSPLDRSMHFVANADRPASLGSVLRATELPQEEARFNEDVADGSADEKGTVDGGENAVDGAGPSEDQKAPTRPTSGHKRSHAEYIV